MVNNTTGEERLHRRERLRDHLQVARKRFALLHAGRLVRLAEDRRGMDGGRDYRREVRVEQLAAMLGHSERAAEQRLGGRGAEQQERRRPDDLQLLFEPGLAGVDLEPLRRLVDAPAPALLELKVLDHVGQVGVRASDAGRLEPSVELAARRPDEGLADAVLPVARLLAYKHEPRGLPPR